MKAVAGLKMSYQVQQAIDGAKGAVVRGFRHDDSDSALCSHLYTMVRGNRQHRRAFLLSLLNLFDDSSVSSPVSFRLILFSGPTHIRHFCVCLNTCVEGIFNFKSRCFTLCPLQKTEVNMLLFIADNLACFPYQTQEEPLFIMHHVDITLSVSGSNLLQSFKEVRGFV